MRSNSGSCSVFRVQGWRRAVRSAITAPGSFEIFSPARASDAPLALLLAGALLSVALAGPADARSDRAARKDAGEAAERAANHPLVIVVSTGSQHVKVYNAQGRIVASAPVSTGQPGHETPHGVFSIIGKEQMHHSNLYSDAPMPWMERITWSGVALHAGNLPGYPASHGCIRLPYGFSRSLYALTRIGTRVIVARNDPTPHAFAHANLFAPLPTEAAVAAAAARRTQQATREPAGSATSAVAGAAVGLLGISPASAGEMPRVRTREQAAAERAARIASAKARLEAAETSRGNLHMAAKLAAEAAQQAQSALHDERSEAGRIEEARRKVVRDIADVREEFGRLARLASHSVDEASLATGADREQQLEDRLAALAAELDGADATLATEATFVAAAGAKASAADARRAATAADLKLAETDVEQARAALKQQQREDANADRPITIFISRKAGKLYVRQGFDDLFQAPVTIEAADKPLGTHVFTAVGERDDGREMTWNVTTVQPGQASEPRRKSRRRDEAEAAVVDAETAARESAPGRVLDRIVVAPDVRQRIAEFIKPGSSLIVSDHPLSHETGHGTDFVVLTR